MSYVILYINFYSNIDKINNFNFIQYIPYIPPIPPIPPIGLPDGLSSFLSTIIHSVVDINPLTEAASSNATLTTLAGSMIPLSIRLQY